MKTIQIDEIFDFDQTIGQEDKQAFIKAFIMIKMNPIGTKLIEFLFEFLQKYPVKFETFARGKGKISTRIYGENKGQEIFTPYVHKDDWEEFNPDMFKKKLIKKGDKTLTKNAKIDSNFGTSEKFKSCQLTIVFKKISEDGVEDFIYDLENKKISKGIISFHKTVAHEMIHCLHFLSDVKGEYDFSADYENAQSLWKYPLKDNGECWNFKLAELVAVIGRSNPTEDYQRISELTINLSENDPYFRFPYCYCSDMIPSFETINEIFESGKKQVKELLG